MSEKDSITVREGSKNKGMFVEHAEEFKDHKIPQWLSYEEKTHTAKRAGEPIVDESKELYDFTSVIGFFAAACARSRASACRRSETRAS